MFDSIQAPRIAPEILLGSGQLPPLTGPVRLALGDRPMRERHSVMRQCFARIGYRYEFTPLADMPFEADLTFNMLPDVLVAEGTLYGSRNRRTKAIVDDRQDEAVLMVNLQGPHLIEQFGQDLVLGDGEAVLISGTDPSCFTHKPPGKLLSLRVPKSRLTPLLKLGEQSYMRPIAANSAALGLLRNYVGLTWDGQVSGNLAIQRLMSDHIFDLLALTVGATGDAAVMALCNGLQTARLQAVKQDIDRHLDQADLSVEILAGRHSLTPRSLQRLFEAEGTTFTKYVLDQRLRRAYRMLADHNHAVAKISAIAYDCGFGDVSYFNRVFRRHYGAAPSEVRAGSR